jgi:hypothetical protein
MGGGQRVTEQEWLGADLRQMEMLLFQALPKKARERKLRLFACACCRRLWGRLTDERSRRAVEASELFADGRIGRKRLSDAAAAADAALRDIWSAAASGPRLDDEPARGARQVASPHLPTAVSWAVAAQGEEARARADLLRDLVNPFQAVAVDPAWLTRNGGAVRQVAEGMYEASDLGQMPVLADALQEAGCDNVALLNHCRGPGPHARGCWLVDLLLGKA